MACAGVDSLLSGTSALNGGFTGVKIAGGKFKDLFQEWLKKDAEDNGVRQAQAFSVKEDMPLTHNALFKVQKWTAFHATMTWTMFLSMACCVATYSPLIEHIEFPQGPNGCDKDGLPKKN